MYVDGKNSFYDNVVSGLPGGKCPDIKNVICTTEISSAGDTSISGSQINQQCGNDVSPSTAPTTASATTAPITAAATSAPISTTQTSKPITLTSAPSSSTSGKITRNTTPPPSSPFACTIL